MSLAIDDKPIVPRRAAPVDQEFWDAVKSLKVGQSFLYGRMDSNLRNGLHIAEMLLGIELASKKEGSGFRVGRTS